MKSILRGVAISVVLSVASGCTPIITKVAVPGSDPNGIRIPGKALFMYVGTTTTSFACHSVDEGAYDVLPASVFAKHDVRIEVDDCDIKIVDIKQDTTLSIGLFDKAVAPIVGSLIGTGKAVATPAIQTENFGFSPGIYRLGRDHRWHQTDAVCNKGNPSASCTAFYTQDPPGR